MCKTFTKNAKTKLYHHPSVRKVIYESVSHIVSNAHLHIYNVLVNKIFDAHLLLVWLSVSDIDAPLT